MRLTTSSTLRPAARQRAVTLLELMVSISLLTLIVLGLYSMFNQTQEALRRGSSQVDVLESGRAAMEILVRELEQMRPSGQTNGTNLYVAPNPVGFPLVQQLVDDAYVTNQLQTCFFLTKQTDWKAIAYIVSYANSTNAADLTLLTNGVGTLSRIEFSTNHMTMTGNNLFNAYWGASLTNYSRVSDGIVHFSLRAFDTNGFDTNGLSYVYTNTHLPAYLEVELGVLEPQVLEQARAMPSLVASSNFLAQQSSKVHLFRQRIPVRTVTP